MTKVRSYFNHETKTFQRGKKWLMTALYLWKENIKTLTKKDNILDRVIDFKYIGRKNILDNVTDQCTDELASFDQFENVQAQT
jgi:hypothetical protein